MAYTRSLNDWRVRFAEEGFDEKDLLEVIKSAEGAAEKKSSRQLTWTEAPPAGLEPATLRLTVECSAN